MERETLNTKSGGGKCNKAGRNSNKCKKYRANKTREKNKIKKVLQSNGKEAVIRYAADKELDGYLKKLLG